MMGAGKSALGRAVAERSGVAFVDLDVEVERRAGMSIRQIFEKQGEAAFRVMEREGVARELADPTPRVIAVGGGSLLTRSLRLQALARASSNSITRASVGAAPNMGRLASPETRRTSSAGVALSVSTMPRS